MGHQEPNEQPRGRYLLTLSLGALGVVYGDIGTSPLYALKECFHGGAPPGSEHALHRLALSHDNVLGVLSLVFWALVLVVSIKYLVFVMRADNRGEGGILALMALVAPGKGLKPASRRPLLIVLGLFGAALLYGDGMITPAISVLSAVEGLEVVSHDTLKPYVLPITVAILTGLFVVQRTGTDRVGKMFGPIMMLWFATLVALGLPWILKRPEVLAAANPVYAVRFMIDNHWKGYVVLGSVFLVVTGGEALYADMGHFGRRPIR
ncbi:MAG: KUP/HAK/KT family potassium transporter, partial [Deltaproteobacteria bacterium]|nr:KUP/HAK/KT family potassium transporter [Deltaproteobacteria bacterium]